MADYNRRFAKPPRHDSDVHRPIENNENLEATFTWREQRKISKSLTLQYDKKLDLLEDNEENRRFQGKYIDVWQYPDGTIELRHNGTSLPFITNDRLRELDQGAIVDSRRFSRPAITLAEVVESMELTRCQCPRQIKLSRELGLAGLVSRRRGKPGNHQLNTTIRDQALQLILSRGQGMNPSAIWRRLTTENSIQISKDTVRKLMTAEKNCIH